MAKIRQVRRADGSLVPFRERKVAEAIARALASAGTPDRALAYELAGAVSLYLSRSWSDEAPTTAEVRQVLGRVLRETGHERAAACFESYVLERARLERELLVRYPRGTGEGPLTEDGSEEVAPWSRARLVASLMQRREIPEMLAEEVATVLEDRLIRCGYRMISRGLLSEMVDHELMEQGLHGVREPDVSFRVPRSRVRDLVDARDPVGAVPLGDALAAPLLEAYALSDLHGPETVAAHQEGRMVVHGLEAPLRLERLVLPLDAFGWSLEDDLERALVGLRGTLEALRPHVRTEIQLPDLVQRLGRLPQAGESPERLVELLFGTLDFRDAFARPSSPRIHLVLPLETPGASGGTRFQEVLVEALGGGGSLAGSLGVSFLLAPGEDLPESGLLDRALELATVRSGVYLRIPRNGGSQWPAGQLPVPLTLSVGRITVNLPLALADAREGDLAATLGRLEPVGNAALTALKERFWLHREGRPHGLHGVVVRLGGPGRVRVRAHNQEVDVDIWGLPFALELLRRRGVIHEGQLTVAACRMLAFLDYLLGGEWEGLRFRVRLGGVRDRGLRRRLYAATETWARRFGVEDLAEVLTAAPEDAGVLPLALPLLSPRNRPFLDASFAERIGPGLALSISSLGEGGTPRELLDTVRSGSRLGLLDLARRRPGEDLFEVQEELFG